MEEDEQNRLERRETTLHEFKGKNMTVIGFTMGFTKEDKETKILKEPLPEMSLGFKNTGTLAPKRCNMNKQHICSCYEL